MDLLLEFVQVTPAEENLVREGRQLQAETTKKHVWVPNLPWQSKRDNIETTVQLVKVLATWKMSSC